MNTPLRFDHEKRSGFQFDRSDYRAHYQEVAAETLSSIVRHRWLIVSLVALGLALACIMIPILPRKYRAEALIYPNLFSHEEKVVPLASIDAAPLITGEANLIRSDAFLRTVAKRLWQGPTVGVSRSLPTQSLEWVRATLLPETRNGSPFDRLVAMLRTKVVVMNDTRSYIISVSFTASSADEAARVVNAFAIEYLRDKAVQRRRERLNSADAELRQQLEVYGDRHPKTLRAKAELDGARASFEAAMNPQNDNTDEIASNQSVKLAVPNQTPTSPRGLVILGLSSLSALVAGIGLAVWRDRRQAKRKRTLVHQTHPE
jgi:uncharacterized protein involved in exopolysaccharide biosynthesis